MPDDTMEVVKPQSGPQEMFLSTPADIAVYGGAAGGGKASHIDSLVATPSGFKRMGDLRVGQEVCTPGGSTTFITQIHPQGIQQLYKVSFADGAATEVTSEHLWKYYEAPVEGRKDARAWKLAGTSTLMRMVRAGGSVSIPLTEPVQFIENCEVGGFPPYTMGVLLAGGCPRLSFIPERYLYGSIDQRFELVRGLMDTNGHRSNDGKASYNSTSEQLAKDIRWLAQSLGGMAAITSKIPDLREGTETEVGRKRAYTVHLHMRDTGDLFRLKYKSSGGGPYARIELKRRVLSIEPSRMAEAQCITLDDADGLYITDDFIVTHNSYALLMEPLRHSGVRNFSGVIFRKSYAQVMAEGGPWQTGMELYPKFGATPKIVDRAFQFPSGARIKFAYLDSDADKLEYQGSQIAFIGFDELTHFSEGQFWYLLSRNRSTCGVRPYIRATTNPDPDSWVRGLINWWIDPDTGLAIEGRSGVIRWFIKDGEDLMWYDNEKLAQAEFPDIIPKSFTFIKASLEDNKILMAADPGYKSSLQALSTVDRAQLLDGNWDVRAIGGTVFKSEWFEIVDSAPPGGVQVVACDLAATKGAGDWTVIVEYTKHPSGVRFITCVTRFRGDPLEVERKLWVIASSKPKGTAIYIPQDPGQAGKFQAAHLSRQLAGYNVRFSPVMGSKVERALPVSALAEAGNVKLVRGHWVKALISELRDFPSGKHDDQVDAIALAEERVSSARNHFALVL